MMERSKRTLKSEATEASNPGLSLFFLFLVRCLCHIVSFLRSCSLNSCCCEYCDTQAQKNTTTTRARRCPSLVVHLSSITRAHTSTEVVCKLHPIVHPSSLICPPLLPAHVSGDGDGGHAPQTAGELPASPEWKTCNPSNVASSRRLPHTRPCSLHHSRPRSPHGRLRSPHDRRQRRTSPAAIVVVGARQRNQSVNQANK